MTDEDALGLMPAVREFVQLVGERDQAGVQAAFAHTPAATLAVLAAELVADAARQRDLAAQAFQRAYAEWRAKETRAAEKITRDAQTIADLKRDRAAQADRTAHYREKLHEATVRLEGRK